MTRTFPIFARTLILAALSASFAAAEDSRLSAPLTSASAPSERPPGDEARAQSIAAASESAATYPIEPRNLQTDAGIRADGNAAATTTRTETLPDLGEQIAHTPPTGREELFRLMGKAIEGAEPLLARVNRGARDLKSAERARFNAANETFRARDFDLRTTLREANRVTPDEWPDIRSKLLSAYDAYRGAVAALESSEATSAAAE